MTYEALSLFNTYESEEEFDAALDELIDRGLLLFDRERGRYDLHPIVRGYAYDRLADKKGTHTRLRDYFAAVPEPERVESLDDLAPVIELYHHTVRAGQYDEAWELYRDRLSHLLYDRFGVCQTCIELLHALFPDGDDKPPRLNKASGQGRALNSLANSCTRSGQPRRAVSVWRVALPLVENLGEKRNIAIGLGNLAAPQTLLGEFAVAEQNLRRQIELCRKIGNEFWEAVGHRDLGLLLTYWGVFDKAAREFNAALASFSNHLGATQSECVVWAYRAIRALLMDKAKAALEAARKAREMADVEGYERDVIRAEWLLGVAHRALGHLPEAESHLIEALTRCRRINLVELEPDMLLEMARLWWAQAGGDEVTSDESTRLRDEALKLAREALEIADRCEYRLKQADIHNFLACLPLARSNELRGMRDEGGRTEELAEARKHAEIARERAWCDGPPHCYKPALKEAERLLAKLSAGC